MQVIKKGDVLLYQGNRKWKKRYAVLHASHELIIFKDSSRKKTICSVLLQSDGCSVVEAHDSEERSFMQINTGNSSLRLTTKDPFQFKKWHDALLASQRAVKQQPNVLLQASGSLQQQFPPMAAEQQGTTNQPEASQPSSSIRLRKPSVSLRSTASQFMEDEDTIIERDLPMNQWESQLSLDGSLNCGGQIRWRKDKLLARGGGGSVFRGSVQLNSADWQRCVIKVIRLPVEAGANDCEDCTTGIRRAICSAMQYIHTRQPPVIHRDINGWNIMVLRGTANFMAPELLAPENEQDPARYSAKSDIWAFGCTVYLMVTGGRPHTDCQNMLAMARRLSEVHGAPRLPEITAISKDLRDFYSRCTAWTREDRWSAERLLRHGFLADQKDYTQL
uniref:Protein kinase domain-containing protein n=2 Tax=Macrostomum lignano TaxID=282301 RepID=A0A1I8GLL5_9PLAT